MARIRARVAGQGEAVGFERCLPAVAADDPRRELMARSAVASSLVAVLELMREREVVVIQFVQAEAAVDDRPYAARFDCADPILLDATASICHETGTAFRRGPS